MHVSAWVAWVSFLVCCIGGSVVAEAVKRDAYFVRHYEHYPMNPLTRLVTAYPIWIAIVPILWLPFIILYHRNEHPGFGMLILQVATMLIATLALALMIICAGPGIQM